MKIMKFVFVLLFAAVCLLLQIHEGNSARVSHGTGLLTRVIRRYQPSQMDERRRDFAVDPWALSAYYGGSYYPTLLEEDPNMEEENLAAEPSRLVVPRNNNKRGSTVIRLIKRSYQDNEDN